MDLNTQLYLITGGYLLFTFIAIWQAFNLWRTYKSRAAWIIAFTFLLWGLRQVKGAFQLDEGVGRAKMIVDALHRCGIIIPGVPASFDRLTPDIWLNIAWGYAIILGFILYQHQQHRDLKRLGI